MNYTYYQANESSPGRLKSVTSVLSSTSDPLVNHFSYTSKGQIYRKWGDTVIPIQYSYDEYGQVESYTTFSAEPLDWSSGAQTTSFSYDEATGVVLTKTDAFNHTRRYDYEPWGRLSAYTNAREQVASFDYDPIQAQLAFVQFDGDNDLTHDVSYRYDRLGRINEIEDGVFDYGIDYDKDTLQLKHLHMDGSSTNGLNKAFTAYYENEREGIAGRPSGWVLNDVNGSNVQSEMSVSYGYDVKGRLESLRSTHTPGADDRYFYQYQEGSNFLNTIRYELPSDQTELIARYTYSEKTGKVTVLKTTIDGNTNDGTAASMISRYTYAYDETTELIDNVYNEVEGDSSYTTRYKYDEERFQLSEVQNYVGTGSSEADKIADENWSYAYDNMGNRLTATERGVAGNYTTNSLNQYTFSSAKGNLLYDADGNMTEDGTWIYTWDALNRLVGQAPKTVAVNSEKFTYRYDYMSRRIQKIVKTWDGSNWITQTNEKYLYDGWNLVAVYNGRSGNKLLRTYTWGTDISGTIGGAGGIGGLLSVQEHSGDWAGKKFLYVYDAVGNVTQLIDAADGSIAVKYAYDPYGRKRVITGNGYERVNPFRFQTKYHDDGSGLIYYGYRYYSHGLGRFINQDPIGEKGGLNLYAFVGNDPVNQREYLGLYVPQGYEPGPDNPCPGPDYEWKCAKTSHYQMSTVKNFADNVEAGSGRKYMGPKAGWYTYDCKWEKDSGIGAFMKKVIGPAVGAVATIASGGFLSPVAAAAIGGFAGGTTGALANGASIEDALISGVIGGAVAAGTVAILHNPPDGFVGEAPDTIHDSFDVVVPTTGEGVAAQSASSATASTGTSLSNVADEIITLDTFIVNGGVGATTVTTSSASSIAVNVGAESAYLPRTASEMTDWMNDHAPRTRDEFDRTIGARTDDGNYPDWRYDGNPATHNINTEGNIEFRFNGAGSNKSMFQGWQLVYDENGKLVTDIVNRGTWDAISPTRSVFGHFRTDVVPWIISGNGTGDLSTSGQRLGAMLLTTGRGVCAGVGKLGECIIP